jgi:glyoxylase-like metal-dependent hydrolase (beta-lactamase superfamily II)
MKLCDDVYLIGSGSLGFDWTHPADCNVYAVDTGDGVVLVDSGTGLSADDLLDHLAGHGFRPDQVTHILLTHLHADHSGGAAALRKKTGAKIVVLEAAARVFEAGREEDIELPRARRAGYYPEDYRWQGCKADVELHDRDIMQIGEFSSRRCTRPAILLSTPAFTFPTGRRPCFSAGTPSCTGEKFRC